MKEIVDALCESFPDDPSAPSVVFSRLPNGKYYGALHRFLKPFGGDRQVLFKCSELTLEGVFAQLRTQLGMNDVPGSQQPVPSDGSSDNPVGSREAGDGQVESTAEADTGGQTRQ